MPGPGPVESMYNIASGIAGVAASVPVKLENAARTVGTVVKSNAQVAAEAAPFAAAQLTGAVALTHDTGKLTEKELNAIALQKRGISPTKDFFQKVEKLPAEVQERNERIGKIQTAMDGVTAALFPNIWAEKYFERGTRVDRLLGEKTEPTNAHLAEKPITRAAKVVADIGARAIPLAGVLTGSIGPVEGLLVSEAMAAANTFASDFAAGWRVRMAKQKDDAEFQQSLQKMYPNTQ